MPLDNQSAKQVVLRSRPDGPLKISDFAIESGPVPDVADGTFLVRNIFVSVDPMLRIFIDQKPLGNAAMPGLPIGSVIPGAAVGEVIESRHPDFKVGDAVEGRFGWQHYAVSKGQGVVHVPASLGGLENALGIGGLPGFTAYIGLNVAGGIKPGQTVLVSGAAGAVGSAVGALVKARGGRVVGIAGGEAKRDYLLDQVGYDAVADRHSPDFHAQLAEALPQGANVYFDNVGGPMLAEMMPYMAFGGLVLISGLMAQYQGGANGGQTVRGDGQRRAYPGVQPIWTGCLASRVRTGNFGPDRQRRDQTRSPHRRRPGKSAASASRSFRKQHDRQSRGAGRRGGLIRQSTVPQNSGV